MNAPTQIIAPRQAEIVRTTSETDISLSLNIDGEGVSTIETGVGFFDHMLTQIAKHGLFDLNLKTKGDLHIDDHHTVEDTGIALGQALAKALGDKSGIARVGNCTLPMDEALVACDLDISGRGFLASDFRFTTDKVGDYTAELTVEFFRAVATNAGWTVHFRQLAGTNAHHIIEAAFKAFARAARKATELDPRVKGTPSTKGTL